MAKRLISMIIGIIILFLVMISNNIYVFDIALTIIAFIAMYEFYNAFRQKGIKSIDTIGYIATLGLLFINNSFVSSDNLKIILVFGIPIILFISLFMLILSNMKKSIEDIMVTIFGVIYITYSFMFLGLTRNLPNGELFVWYILGGAWITDTFAFLIGSKLGKHKFSKISPNKSIEGCIAGIIATSAFYGIYSNYLINNFGIELNLFKMILLGIIVSVISQIGDLTASAIKRFCNIKDFGNIMPGHGGVLDRFDSIILISPFVYMFLQFFK